MNALATRLFLASMNSEKNPSKKTIALWKIPCWRTWSETRITVPLTAASTTE